MASTRVALLGATGETGTSILNELLKDDKFSIVALIRPSSLQKPSVQAFRQKGIEIRGLDLEAPLQTLVAALKDIDILISAIGPMALLTQIPLATAAKEAGVKRFVPCAFITIAPPDGIMLLRDEKEKVYNHIKKIYLPFTVIDVGWWYQGAFPKLPSGKIDYMTGAGSMNLLCLDGNTPSALTDLRDIGKYVARIIVDDRTVNKYVFTYNEVWTPNQIYDKFEDMSGERPLRKYLSEKEIQDDIISVKQALDANPSDTGSMIMRFIREYQFSWGIRGDNTPEYAKFLGYISSKELYPDLEFRDFGTYLKEVLDGKATPVYASSKDSLTDLVAG
ncbi:hypothetical protein AJ80_00841 [Polytolypa hystricis UAMH7299]|uniref:NmrA-like domain-containing protein n=1 Tax=Polytolypa hystricis (strain UAMH7299) TaxID=1447883 RepID=A0A2B7Z2B9_POLH7|nr:hypothetical protein AJ80_00841 [Polytolypa hystricis UAMH7299]